MHEEGRFTLNVSDTCRCTYTNVENMHMEEKTTPARPDHSSSSRTSFNLHPQGQQHSPVISTAGPVDHHPRLQLFNPLVPY